MYWHCMSCNIQPMTVVVHDYCTLTDYHYVSFEKHSKIIMEKRKGENCVLTYMCWRRCSRCTRPRSRSRWRTVSPCPFSLSFHTCCCCNRPGPSRTASELGYGRLYQRWCCHPSSSLERENGDRKKQLFTGLCLICGLRTILPLKSPF